MARSDAGTEHAGGTVACGSGVATGPYTGPYSPGFGDRGRRAAPRKKKVARREADGRATEIKKLYVK